ncbi:hypothetical protein L0F63_002345, partial [Massospora cicadina]
SLSRSLRLLAGEKGTLEDVCENHSTRTCSICLGLLQPKCYQEISHVVKLEIEKEGYDATVCYTNVAISTGAIVRGKLFWAQVRSLLPTLASEEALPSIKQTIRLVVGYTLEKAYGLRYSEKGPLHINISLSHDETAQEHLIFQKGGKLEMNSNFEPKWAVLGNSRSKVGDNLKRLSDELVAKFQLTPCTPVASLSVVEKVDLFHDSIFIAGRYLKLVRGVSQTPWVVNGQTLAEHSVSSFIDKPSQKLFNCSSTNFVTAGREDADVRMLGTGRPFALEICNPRRTQFKDLSAELKALTAQINRSQLVNTTTLHLISREGIEIIKEGEQTKVKTYRALVWVASSIPNQEHLDEVLSRNLPPMPLNILQNTPLRVLHRRSPLLRPKVIHQLRLKWLHPHYLVVDLVAEAGTYIKEFVHSDVGRTSPSLKTILAQPSADLLELDVIHVDLEWPPASHTLA